MRKLVALTVIVAGSALPPAPLAGAVQADSGGVPMDLVIALLGGRDGGARVFIGGLTPALEGRIPVGQAERVVGGVARGSRGTVVVEVSGTASEALRNYGSYMERQGWRRPALPPGRGGGFQSSTMARQNAWCGEEYAINASSLAVDSATYLRIGYQSLVGGRSICDMEGMPRFDSFGGPRFPSLEPPRDAVVRGGGRGSSPDHIETDASVESALSSERIFQHYADQLTAAGWVPEGQTAAEGVTIGRWSTQDDEGVPVTAVLAVWRLAAPNTHKAWVRMDRPDARR